MNSASKNLVIMGIAQFFIKMQFWFPIWVIFLLDKGFTLTQIVIADVAYWVLIAVFEFPMGIVGDKIGRRKTYFLGATLGAIAYLLMINIENFATLLLSWSIWAVFVATLSGTDTAFIYELILEAGLQHRAKHILGYFGSIQSIAFIVSTLAAGFLYKYDPDLPIFINFIVAIIAAFTILLIPDIPSIISFKSSDQIKSVFEQFRHNRQIQYVILFIAILYAYTYAVTLILQHYLQSIGIPIGQFGLIFASFPVFAVIGGLLTGRLADKIGPFKHLIINSSLLVISVFLIGILPGKSGIVAIVLLYLCFSLINPILLDRLNVQVSNHYRSSIISFANLVSSAVLMLARPGIVYFAEITTIATSFIIWGCIGCVFLVILFLSLADMF